MEKSIGMEEIKNILPEKWEEKAYELEAMGRSRNVKTAEDLLRLNMLYVTSGCSIGGTSSILRASVAMKLNKNAVAERLEKSEEWLRWLSENMSVNAGLVSARPAWLEYRRVLGVDATREVSPDAEKTVWNLHYMLDIFSLEAAEIKLTDEKCGEKLENYETVSRGDIMIGDRVYGTIKSIEYAYNRMADYVFRLKADAFNLYDATGKQVDMKKKIRRMRESAYKVFDLHYKYGGELKPIRICVYRKDATEIKEISVGTSERQKFYHNYVIVGTSLRESADKILELYRLRWQIELLFKRLKSIFNLDELKAKKAESVRVWFYCKLLLAAICETLDNMGRFSPIANFPLSQASKFNEMRLLFHLVQFAVLMSLGFQRVFQKLHEIPLFCANSKRNRRYSITEFSAQTD